MDNYEKSRVRKHINRLAIQDMLKDKNIVLFGASGFSKDVLMCLEERGFTANAIIDNDDRKVGISCLGMIVKTPEQALMPFSENNLIIFYSPGFYREMTAQLERMGYHIDKHIFALNFQINDTLYMFTYMTKTKIRGLYWHKKITCKHSPNCPVFIAPYTGTGDIYLIGLFFHTYLKQQSITDYVFAVVSNACKKVAEMFNIKNIYVLPHQVGDDMISLQRATGQEFRIITLNDGWLGDPLQWFRGYNGLNFEKMFRYFVFGFDDTIPHILPPKRDYSHEIDGLFQQYNIVKGKTVVLSPYSNTLFDLPDDVLASIVNHCKQQGLTPVTNCAGTEKPVTGTDAVFFPLNQAIEFMNAAGYFVGVRSGLCDIISSSTCKKIIIYDKNGLFYKTSHFDYFSLKKMGLCVDAIEIEYSNDVKNECLHKIKETLK
ncbi:MAG: hypothetical protein FWC91_04665 [Defluviitaleaceae bacterium]|nr:hypothetical protein [Defluviitaleaceae bacterium]